MKYKGIELKEITEPQIFDPPKDMLVWDDDDDSCSLTQASVCAIVRDREYPVITSCWYYRHCAYCPEINNVTFRELSRWLSKGNGEVMSSSTVGSNWNYFAEKENKVIPGNFYVRKWEDTEWHKPTREYLGLED